MPTKKELEAEAAAKAAEEAELQAKLEAEEAAARAAAAEAAKNSTKSVRMIRDADEANGGPTTADVHPDEVSVWSQSGGWRVAPKE